MLIYYWVDVDVGIYYWGFRHTRHNGGIKQYFRCC